MKKLISIFCLLMALAMLAMPVFAASGSVSLAASKTTLYTGDTFTVTARLSNSEPIALGTVVLSYDSSVFEMTGGVCNVSGVSLDKVIPENKAGTFMFSGDPQVVSGTIFTFNMKVKDGAAVGSHTISSSASIGVSTGEGISSGSVTVTVTCDHNYGAWTEAETGHSQTCSKCGTVNTQDHKWNRGTVTQQPTCSDEGVKTYTCSVCNATKEESIAATGKHTFGNLTSVDENNHKDTCSTCNKEVTEAHTWNRGTVTQQPTCSDEGVKTFTCTGCKATKEEAVAATGKHTFGNLTPVDEVNHKDTCSVCNKEVTEAHTWNRGVVTKKATCAEEGEKTFTCTGCKTTKVEKIEKLTTHTWSKWAKTDDATHKRNCTVCQLEETGEHSYKESWSKDRNNHFHECSVCKDQKDVTAHTPGPEATEKSPQICTECKYVIKPALEHIHEYAEEWTTDENGHWYICDGCEEKGEYADHDFENACDTDCAICGFTRETEHTYGDQWVTDKDNHYHECSGCGDIQDKDAHISGGAATAEAAEVCTVCGYEIAPKLEAEPTEPANIGGNEKGDFPWWIVIVIAAAAVVVAAVVILKKKNKV